ncbi:hypothetical protein H4R99_003526 [Coemansia sp. RSA 1722]|nr:hypothetical protein IWW45_001721 [Coemansia sp. RSA 485]KAJ2599912.1 hypothetical protein H4R99_003526 [Coemansia sp. RSA 1722]
MSDHETANQAKKPRYNKQAPQPTTASASASTMTEDQSETKKAILQQFTKYRDTLDSHYDQRERVIKTSRDITALSKKMVFTLLRITQEPATKVFKEVEDKNAAVLSLFSRLSKDIQGSDAYKYNCHATHGLQEYIEALGLWVFLRDNKLITKGQVEEMLASKGARVLVTDGDYVLGISDLPGEVNRYCINAIGKGDRKAVENSLVFLRALREGINLLVCSGRIKDLHKKLDVLESSLEKTEKTYYSMSIRQSEMAAVNEQNKGVMAAD